MNPYHHHCLHHHLPYQQDQVSWALCGYGFFVLAAKPVPLSAVLFCILFLIRLLNITTTLLKGSFSPLSSGASPSSVISTEAILGSLRASARSSLWLHNECRKNQSPCDEPYTWFQTWFPWWLLQG